MKNRKPTIEKFAPARPSVRWRQPENWAAVAAVILVLLIVFGAVPHVFS